MLKRLLRIGAFILAIIMSASFGIALLIEFPIWIVIGKFPITPMIDNAITNMYNYAFNTKK